VSRTRTIYADHAATTPCRAEVAVEVVRVLTEEVGNPSSTAHAPGRRAAALVEGSRERVAALIGAHPDHLVFTSGATEACNAALFGVLHRLVATRPKVVVGATEHPAVIEPARFWAEQGAELVVCPVDGEGALEVDALAELVDERTALVAAMLVNNETGVVHDLPAVAEVAHRRGALVLCDATQALGRMAVEVARLGADLLACSAHKLYGPKGVGALWIRPGLGISPLIHGGGQERGRRGGTSAVPVIAGFGLAAEKMAVELDVHVHHLRALHRELEERLRRGVPGLRVHGAHTRRAPGITMVTASGVPRGWLVRCRDLAASGGSACSSGSADGSRALQAMGIAPELAANAIRLSFGRESTMDEVVAAAGSVVAASRAR